MKNARECYEVLLRGDKLRKASFPAGDFVALSDDGRIVDAAGRQRYFYFTDADRWHIYQEPRWEDALEDGPVLCWVSHNKGGGKITPALITGVVGGSYSECSAHFWNEAVPITREEFERYNGRLFPVKE